MGQTNVPAPLQLMGSYPLLSGQKHSIIDLYKSIDTVEGLRVLLISHSIIMFSLQQKVFPRNNKSE